MAKDKASKKNKKYKALGQKLLSGLAIGLICAALVLLLSLTGFIRRLELISLDWRFMQRDPIVKLPEVGYVNLDNASCDMVGQWPWDRKYHGALVKTLNFYGARAAGYDVFYIEPSGENVTPPTLFDVQGGGTELLDDMFRNYDGEFEKALAESKIIYLGEFLITPNQVNKKNTPEAIRVYIAKDKENWNDVKKDSMAESIKQTFDAPDFIDKSVSWGVEVQAPLGHLARAAAGLGFEQIIPDESTGTVYEYPMFIHFDGNVYPALGLKIVADILGIDFASLRGEPGSHIELDATRDFKDYKAGPLRIPVNGNIRLLMNWSGPYFETFFHISFKQLSYWYAANTLKEKTRNSPVTPSNVQDVTAKFEEHLLREKFVPAGQARPLAEEIALASLYSNHLGMSDAELLALAPKDVAAQKAELVLQGLRLAEALAKGASPEQKRYVAEHLASPHHLDIPGWAPDTAGYPALNADHQREIARNVLALSDDLTRVSPLYFPPALETQNDGKIIPLSPTMLKDKILMIGLEGEGTIDLNPQPYEKACAMVALHSNAINTLLTRQFLQFSKPYETWIAVFACGLLVGLASHLMSGVVSFVFMLLLAALYGWFTIYSFDSLGKHVEIVSPYASLILTYFVSMGVQLYLAFREKQKVKGMFGKMVSPEVLKVMSDNPDMFSLSGRRQACTSFFSSMEGFAKMAEGVTAQELPRLLGHYLTPSSQIITSYEGYIDKYESHIIMADFGVPIPDELHPTKCLYAAVEQQLDINSFKKYAYARFGKEVVVSMGVNTGFVSAGNMGSERKMQYTIMGDTVNTAARFRPANWIYNQLGSIIIGETTYPIVKDEVEVRMLDKLLLKGKLKPITIYQIMGWKRERYLELRKHVDVAPTLKTCWTRLPAEKIFGYHLSWGSYADKADSELAREISQFFGGHLGAAAKLLELEVKAESMETCLNYRAESERHAKVLGRPLADIPKGDWDARLENWSKQLHEVLEELEPKRLTDPEIQKLYLNLDDVHGKVDALLHRLRLQNELQPDIDASWDRIREYIATSFNTDNKDYRGLYAQEFAKYEQPALAFAEKIAARREEYHEMMSHVGSRSSAQVKGCEVFGKALSLYWNRDWDAAEKKFGEVLQHMPGDNAAQCFIDRVKTYRDNPPKPTWQGEFVQTKK